MKNLGKTFTSLKSREFLKTCTCGNILYQDNVKMLGDSVLGRKRITWFNCLKCMSTMTISKPLEGKVNEKIKSV